MLHATYSTNANESRSNEFIQNSCIAFVAELLFYVLILCWANNKINLRKVSFQFNALYAYCTFCHWASSKGALFNYLNIVCMWRGEHKILHGKQVPFVLVKLMITDGYWENWKSFAFEKCTEFYYRRCVCVCMSFMGFKHKVTYIPVLLLKILELISFWGKWMVLSASCYQLFQQFLWRTSKFNFRLIKCQRVRERVREPTHLMSEITLNQSLLSIFLISIFFKRTF